MKSPFTSEEYKSIAEDLNNYITWDYAITDEVMRKAAAMFSQLAVDQFHDEMLLNIVLYGTHTIKVSL